MNDAFDQNAVCLLISGMKNTDSPSLSEIITFVLLQHLKFVMC